MYEVQDLTTKSGERAARAFKQYMFSMILTEDEDLIEYT